MPTYTNISSKSVYLEYDDYILKPGETFQTYYFYNYDSLRMDSVTPVINPIISSEKISLTSDVTRSLDNVYKVELAVSGGDVYLYFNSNGTTPKYVNDGSLIELIIEQPTVSSIIISPAGGTPTVVLTLYSNDVNKM